MTVAHIKTLTAFLLLLGVVGAGAGSLGYRLGATETREPGDEQNPAAEDRQARRLTDTIKVPSAYAGVLLFLGTDIKPDEKVPANLLITVKVGGEVKKYRRLREGDPVEPGQLLGRVDDRVARDEYAIQMKKVARAEADLAAAEATRDEAKAQLDVAKRMRQQTRVAMSEEEFRTKQLAAVKYSYEAVSKRADLEIARLQLRQAQTILDMHEIRSPARGVIRSFYKLPGEAVRELEPVVAIQVPREP